MFYFPSKNPSRSGGNLIIWNVTKISKLKIPTENRPNIIHFQNKTIWYVVVRNKKAVFSKIAAVLFPYTSSFLFKDSCGKQRTFCFTKGVKKIVCSFQSKGIELVVSDLKKKILHTPSQIDSNAHQIFYVFTKVYILF